MDEVNHDVYIVDRVDQVRWYLDEHKAHTFVANLAGNHHSVRSWLVRMTRGVVVISGQGIMPRIGTMDHPFHELLVRIQKDQFKIYFANDQDAMLFKLTWGGDIQL